MTTKELLLGSFTFLVIACNNENKKSKHKKVITEKTGKRNLDTIFSNSENLKIENLK